MEEKRGNRFDTAADYRALHSRYPAAAQRPVIGITANSSDDDSRIAHGYYQSVLRAGGIPLIIPVYSDAEPLCGTLQAIDGLILTGGGDINPLYLGEEPLPQLHSINPLRDRQELLLARMATDRQMPLLGICRGIQVLTAAMGGTLHQDIATQAGGPLVKHSQELQRGVASHSVQIKEGTLLSRIFGGCEKLFVNSFHHQAVSRPAPGYAVCATAPDGIVEAVESTEHKPFVGVQWHPECFILNGDESMMPLFGWLVEEAASFAAAKRLHSRTLTLDSHCDTPMFFDRDIRFYTRDSRILVDLHKMEAGGLDASIMVAYLKQEARDPGSLRRATEKADRILTQIEQMAAQSSHAVEIARTPARLYALKREGKRGIMLGIENGYAIGDDLSNVERFRRRGVVYLTLCHNGDNDLCDSAKGAREHGGLSELGRRAIAEMNRTGMMVDLSHASEESFYQAIECSRQPIVCSHSSCRALCDHPRNLTDEQMRALAASGGVVQITLYNGFLDKDEHADLATAVRHIVHAVQVAGIEHVGIGTDFDGDGGIPGCASASELVNLTRALMREGFGDDDLEKIWGGNFLRLMERVQAAGCVRF